MIISIKRVPNYFLLIALLFVVAMPYNAIAQIGNTQPPSSTSGVGQNNGSPYNNTSNGGSASGSMSADADDPGGPTDPPSDVVPIDGGVTILLAIGLVHGYLISRRRTKKLNVDYAIK